MGALVTNLSQTTNNRLHKMQIAIGVMMFQSALGTKDGLLVHFKNVVSMMDGTGEINSGQTGVVSKEQESGKLMLRWTDSATRQRKVAEWYPLHLNDISIKQTSLEDANRSTGVAMVDTYIHGEGSLTSFLDLATENDVFLKLFFEAVGESKNSSEMAKQ